MKSYRFKKLWQLSILLLLSSLVSRCARPMAPVGGPKDITPPRVLKCVPPNHSANFQGDKFTVYFDEYVTLDKLHQQLLISPPMENFPYYKLKRKSLIIRFKDTLKPNTTYSVFFGDAIRDITAGNILHNFSYVFSTGKYVDSLSMRGQVLDALEGTPMKNIDVMLYKNDNDTLSLDSLPLYVKPYYISKTNEQGNFLFSGLADTNYLLFALLDKNYSLTYDLPSEKIAFIDSLVWPQYRPVPVIDSSKFDTITRMPKDSVQLIVDSLTRLADSLANQKLTLYKLYLFHPGDSVQKLMTAKLLRKNTLEFIFSLPADSVKISSLNFSPREHWYKAQWSSEKDTLLWFLRQPHPDTLKLLFMNGKDTLDLTDLRVIPKINRFLRRKKHQPVKVEYLSWKSNLQGIIKPGQLLQILFGQPLSRLRFDSVLLVKGKDSLYNPPHYFLDSIHRRVAIPFVVKPGTRYELNFPDSAAINWNGNFNQAFRISFRSKQAKDYGLLRFKVSPQKRQPYILQMLKGKNRVVASRYFSSAKEISFENLEPGYYRFRIIFDRNGNGKWDPGNYLRHQEPEKVIYYPQKIQVRANWEIDENWNF